MKRSIMCPLVALGIAGLIAGCGQSVPAVPPSAAAPPPVQSDGELLDAMRWNWLAIGEAQYNAGNTDLSFMNAELLKIEQARQALRALEEEKRTYLTASEILYTSGQTDLSAMHAKLQSVEEDRQGVLAGIGVEVR